MKPPDLLWLERDVLACLANEDSWFAVAQKELASQWRLLICWLERDVLACLANEDSWFAVARENEDSYFAVREGLTTMLANEDSWFADMLWLERGLLANEDCWFAVAREGLASQRRLPICCGSRGNEDSWFAMAQKWLVFDLKILQIPSWSHELKSWQNVTETALMSFCKFYVNVDGFELKSLQNSLNIIL